MDNGGSNGAGCLEIEIWTDTLKFTKHRFRKCRHKNDQIKGEVFVKNKAKVASGTGCVEKGVMYFRKLFKSIYLEFSFRRVAIGNHPERNLL